MLLHVAKPRPYLQRKSDPSRITIIRHGNDDENFNPFMRYGLVHDPPRNRAGPSLVMNIIFISGRESAKKKCPERSPVNVLA